MAAPAYQEVLSFWFEEIEPSRWWAKDRELDKAIGERFGSMHAAAARCELSGWRSEPEGRLAEIIVLDQFSRNIYRDCPQAFACDPLALALAQEAIADLGHRSLPVARRNFLYLPFMHSESLAIHDAAAELFEQGGDAQIVEFERKHRRIIERFGRYPHRNAVLGRTSTAEELEFLQQPGSSF